jgi:hypothetical protein
MRLTGFATISRTRRIISPLFKTAARGTVRNMTRKKEPVRPAFSNGVRPARRRIKNTLTAGTAPDYTYLMQGNRMKNDGSVAAAGPDRRDSNYAFTSERELVQFFSSSLPRPVIRKVIAETKKRFVARTPLDRPGIKLQLLKKCEVALVRLARREYDISHEP